MTDLPGFSPKDTAPPPTRAEIKERERELNGLVEWYRTNGNYAAVKKVTKARSNAEVDVIVNRAWRRYVAERLEGDGGLDSIKARQHMDLLRVRDGHIDAAASGDVPASHVIFKMQEREAKLAGSDAQREESGGIQIVVNTARPWEAETIDGEAVEVKEIEG